MEGQNSTFDSCVGYIAAMNPTLFPHIPVCFSFKPQDPKANTGVLSIMLRSDDKSLSGDTGNQFKS